jgi:predicted nucleotidyltransferase component of viral defense system
MSAAGEAVLARLRSIAKGRGSSTDHVLSRWVAERFLSRLSASCHADRLTLKGGFLFALWNSDFLRTTADVDLHGLEEDMALMKGMLLDIASSASPETDGVRFEVGAVRFKALVGGRLPGLRMLLPAEVGTARVQLKVDLGYGHPIWPGVETGWFPSLMPGFTSFAMRAYPRETVIGEKLAVAVEFGRDNTRIRDYHDLWFLSRRYGFEGHVLLDAVRATFAGRDAGGFLQRRDGYWEGAFSPDYATNRHERAWGNWMAEHAPMADPSGLRHVVEEVARFSMPMLCAARDGRSFNRHWSPVKGWRPVFGTSSHTG